MHLSQYHCDKDGDSDACSVIIVRRHALGEELMLASSPVARILREQYRCIAHEDLLSEAPDPVLVPVPEGYVRRATLRVTVVQVPIDA